MGYGSGVRPTDPKKRRGLLLIDQPHRLVSGGAAVVGTLAGVAALCFRAARILTRRP